MLQLSSLLAAWVMSGIAGLEKAAREIRVRNGQCIAMSESF